MFNDVCAGCGVLAMLYRPSGLFSHIPSGTLSFRPVVCPLMFVSVFSLCMCSCAWSGFCWYMLQLACPLLHAGRGAVSIPPAVLFRMLPGVSVRASRGLLQPLCSA